MCVVNVAIVICSRKVHTLRCAALDTFEAMLHSGCRPHAAVYSSIIDVLWQAGITWAQVKALSLFNSAVGCAALKVSHTAHSHCQ